MTEETTNPTTAELLVIWDEARTLSVPAPKRPSVRAGCTSRRGHPARPDSTAIITDG
jgi:hypothetical protein